MAQSGVEAGAGGAAGSVGVSHEPARAAVRSVTSASGFWAEAQGRASSTSPRASTSARAVLAGMLSEEK